MFWKTEKKQNTQIKIHKIQLRKSKQRRLQQNKTTCYLLHITRPGNEVGLIL